MYKGEIEAYTKQRLALLKWLYRHMPEEEFYAKINFIRLLKLGEYEEFIKKYNLKPEIVDLSLRRTVNSLNKGRAPGMWSS